MMMHGVEEPSSNNLDSIQAGSSSSEGRYWRHFQHMQTWLAKHKSSAFRISQQHNEFSTTQCSCSKPGKTAFGSRNIGVPSPMPHSYTIKKPSDFQNQFSEQISRSRPSRRKSRGKRRKLTVKTDTSDSEQYEVNFTPNFLEFIAQSAQHRKDRDSKKEEEAKIQEKKDRKWGIKTSDSRAEAPTEQPGMRRTHEIQLLYGDRAHKIHGMETAQQLTFQQTCDRLRPLHWPNIPLNITFDDS